MKNFLKENWWNNLENPLSKRIPLSTNLLSLSNFFMTSLFVQILKKRTAPPFPPSPNFRREETMKTFLQILQIRGDISVSFLKIRKLKLSKFLLLSLPWTTKVYWEKTRNYKNSDIPWRCVQLDKLFLKSDYQ